MFGSPSESESEDEWFDEASRKSGLRSCGAACSDEGSEVIAAGLSGGDGNEGGKSGGSRAQSFSAVSRIISGRLTCRSSKVALRRALLLGKMEPHLS